MSLADKLEQHDNFPQEIDAARDIEPLLAQIVESDTFRMAPTMRTLLLYLWQHRTEPISEYAIAVEALGRRPDFDPRIDATARVQIARLRVKLKEFYETKGGSFPLQVSVPVGGHQAVFELVNPDVPASGQKIRQAHPGMTFVALACATLLLAVLCLFLLSENRQLKASATGHPPPLPRFWQSFLRGGKPTGIVVPTPAFFSWKNQRVLVRDLSTLNYADWSKSPFLSQLAKQWGPPELDERYLVAVHALPAVEFLQYLERHGTPSEIVMSPRLAMDDYREQNIIVLGGPKNTGRFQSYLTKRNFEIVGMEPTVIRNLNPRPGEPAEFHQSAQSGQRIVSPGIIAVLPRSKEGTGTMIMIASNPAPLVSMLLSAAGLDLLDAHWNQAGRPDAWEMVVQSEMDGQTVLSVTPAGFRATSNKH